MVRAFRRRPPRCAWPRALGCSLMAFAGCNSVFDVFRASAQEWADRPFLRIVRDTAQRYCIPPGTLCYADAAEQVAQVAQRYRGYGVGPGQRVALLLGNRPEFFQHWLALNALGASAVPLNPDWGAAELHYVLAHSEACMVVTPAQRQRALAAMVGGIERPPSLLTLAAFEPADAAVAPDRPTSSDTATECALLYTSGTTGRPKGCILSNEYFLCGGHWYRGLGGLCQLHPGRDCLATPLPMHHMNAMAVSTMAMLMTGGCIAPLDRFHPSSWWASVAEADATIIHYLGVMPAILLEQPPQALDARHRVRFGFGAGVSAAHHQRFEQRFGFPLVEAWAMTETGLAAAVIANEEPRKIGTACFGCPPPEVDWRIVLEDGADAPCGAPGELLVRRAGERPGFGFFSGYLKDPQATGAAWRDGYFRTGDVVRQDEDGLLHFVDRKKNIIRRSGENIAAVEVETVVGEHPSVAGVGVAPVPDAMRGDEVMALIILSDALQPGKEVALAQRIVHHCLSRLAYYKAPGYIAFCTHLPLTATEKIQRADLKTLALTKLQANECVDTRSLKRRR